MVESGDAELLRELFRADPEVARAWILQQARAFSTQRSRPECRLPWPEIEELLKTAIANLARQDRRDLIRAIPEHADERFFGYLVDADPDLYRVLLRRHLRKEAHLAPLLHQPSEIRERLIRLAQERGYSDCAVEARPDGSAG